MKKIIKLNILLSLSLIFFFGCSEDFLVKRKLGEESTSTFYLTKDNALAALAACYDIMLARGSFSRNFWAFGDVASDDTEAAGEPGGNDQVPAQLIDGLDIVGANGYLFEFYRNIYRGINNCNIVITNVPEAPFDEELKDRIVAEAICLRAIYHWYLNIVFGGIIIADHIAAPDEYYETPRSTIAETLHWIQDELEAVADELPTTYPQVDDGRTTWGTAKGYLLKALVFESNYAELSQNGQDPAERFEGCETKWSEAWDVAQEIITSAIYELEPDYADLWIVGNYASRTGDFSKEHLFKINCISVEIAGRGNEQIDHQIVGSVGGVYQSCRDYYNLDGTIQVNGRRGWGLNAPTYELWDAYETGDPRQDISITSEGDPVLVDSMGTLVYRAASTYSSSPTGMNSAKYDPEPWEWLTTRFFDSPLDIKMLRYADILLLAAEAGLKTNNSTEAMGYVNQIRTRARNSGTTGEPQDLTGELTLAQIQHERRVELALETHRYFDLVRWGIAEDMLDGTIRATDTVWAWNPKPLNWVPGKHEFFPIPESQIVLSRGSMKQNPGY